jgi:hypothetical protein
MDIEATNQFLRVAADSIIDVTIFNSQELKEIEQHIKNNINEFALSDLPMTMAKMIKLNYIPEMLFSEINQMS